MITASTRLHAGRQTGSLINHLYSGSTESEPKVGDGATILGWTDRHPATVIEVGKLRGIRFVTIQYDHAKRVDQNGMSEQQSYEFSPNPAGAKVTYTWRPKVSAWVRKGDSIRGSRLTIGSRSRYHDYSF